MGRKKIAIIAVAVLAAIGIIAFIFKHNSKVVYKYKDTTATISKNGDSGKVTTKDGSLDYGSNVSWPEKDMGNLPKVNAKIITVIKGNSDNTCSVSFKDLSENDAKGYKDQLLNLGYSKNVDAAENDTMYFYGESSKSHRPAPRCGCFHRVR